MSRWDPFEHAFYRHLTSEAEGLGLKDKTLLLAVSGGLDSVALLNLMSQFSSQFGYKIAVVHIHHGPTEDIDLAKFRDSASELVKKQAEILNAPFFLRTSLAFLSSEAEMRDFRKTEIEKIRQQNGFSYTVWAHHEDDFLETQVLRLIRGTGSYGIEPMFFQRGVELRPLLKFSRSQLEGYAKEHKIIFKEDPSNLDSRYLRNWLRNHWLPQLEAKSPGALKAISRSLLLIAQDKENLPEEIFLDQKISRAVYMTLSASQQKMALATYMRMRGQAQFSHNHVEEIMKRLDKEENGHSFKLAHMLWQVSRDWIFADPVLLPK